VTLHNILSFSSPGINSLFRIVKTSSVCCQGTILFLLLCGEITLYPHELSTYLHFHLQSFKCDTKSLQTFKLLQFYRFDLLLFFPKMPPSHILFYFFKKKKSKKKKKKKKYAGVAGHPVWPRGGSAAPWAKPSKDNLRVRLNHPQAKQVGRTPPME
jgi:hypothetical protein